MPPWGNLLERDTLPEPFAQFGAELASVYSYAHPGQGERKDEAVERSEEGT
jgi:hypothetical protein